MSYDNFCKYLAERYPGSFVRWLLGVEVSQVEVLKSELSNEPIRADFLTFLRTQDCLLHIEFQTRTEEALGLRMLDYWVRLYRQYRCPIQQTVVFLQETKAAGVYVNQLQVGETCHSYRVIRLWEVDPDPLLAEAGLLPLATLARSDAPERLLRQVAEQVDKIESIEQRQNLAAGCYVLAGLRFDQPLLKQLFREETMRESVTYQEILQKGVQQGVQQGLQQGLRRELELVLRLLRHRLSGVSPEQQQQIQQLSPSQLEALAEALLDFNSLDDLNHWLASLG